MFMFQIPKSAEEINLKNVSEMSYVFSGAYTPVLCKLIEQVCAVVFTHWWCVNSDQVYSVVPTHWCCVNS